IDVNGKLMRTTQQRFTTDINLDQSRFTRKTGSNKKEENKSQGPVVEPNMSNDLGITSGDINYYNTRQRVDFSMPWSANINYNLTKSYNGMEAVVRQSADLNAN